MKKRGLIMAILLFLGGLGATAQENKNERDVEIRVIDRKGKPVSQIVVESQSLGTTGMTDEKGVYIFKSIPEGDTIRFVMPRIGQLFIPVKEDLDLIQLTLQAGRQVSAVNPDTNEKIDLGLFGTTEKSRTLAADVLDVEAVMKETGATTFAGIIQNQIIGVEILTGTDGPYVSIRGRGPALMVVDGFEYRSLTEVENRFTVYQIKTITINKTGVGYGGSGSNGVVVFTIKK